MDRPSRLRSNDDFQRVRREGRSWATPWVVLVAARNELDRSRFGFAVGKRIGKATVRNRAKRRLREAVRAQRANIPSGWDLLFIARDPLPGATFAQIQQAIGQLLTRSRLLASVERDTAREESRSGPD